MARKIFVSHVWNGQNKLYRDLIRLLDETKRFSFEDLSVPRLRPFHGEYKAVRNEILGILRQADVVLVINMAVITNSEPVKDELREAEECGVPIIAIKPAPRHGKTNASRLDVIRRADKARWTARSIVDAIRRAKKKRPDVSRVATSEPVTDAGYEPVSDAVTDAPPSNEEVAPVRGDDEQLITAPVPTTRDFMHASGATPTAGGDSVRIEATENSSPKRPWYQRFWRW